MKILHLTIKKKWFKMIQDGEKKEEYRELKSYWTKRIETTLLHEVDKDNYKVMPRQFDIVRFRNGYKKDAPQLDVEFKSIYISFGREEWGAEPNRLYYVIRLGEILERRHCTYGFRIESKITKP